MDIKKVAELSRLRLASGEEELFQKQLSSIVSYFEELKNIDTSNIEPLTTPTDIEMYWREDIKKEDVSTEEALQNAPERAGNLFKVPPVV